MSVNPSNNNVSITPVSSDKSHKLNTTGGGSSGYNTGGLASSSAVSPRGHTKEKMELDAREKLKEELLRQYEALNPGAVAAHSSQSAPRQIPTIEDARASSVKRIQVVAARPPSYFPDVSRPPPGYCALPSQVPPGLQLYHQAQHLQLPYNYEVRCERRW